MQQTVLNLDPQPAPVFASAPREMRTLITAEDIPRPEITQIVREHHDDTGTTRLLLVERGTAPATGDWIAVKRADGIRMEYWRGDSSGPTDGKSLGTVIATLPAGKTLRYGRNIRAFPARRAG